MADLKFSCPQCGQHISCGEAWAGHALECPACHHPILVPQATLASAVPVAAAPPAAASTAPGPKPGGPRLAAGATQAPRPAAAAPTTARKFTPRPPRSENSLLKYGLTIIVVAALGGIAYFYGLPLVTNALQQDSSTQTPPTKSSQGRSAAGGPLGEVNEAMDVSETLDSGSAPTRRPAVASTNTARPNPRAPQK